MIDPIGESRDEWELARNDVRRLDAAIGALNNLTEKARPVVAIAALQEMRDLRKQDQRRTKHHHKWLTGGRKPAQPPRPLDEMTRISEDLGLPD